MQETVPQMFIEITNLVTKDRITASGFEYRGVIYADNNGVQYIIQCPEGPRDFFMVLFQYKNGVKKICYGCVNGPYQYFCDYSGMLWRFVYYGVCDNLIERYDEKDWIMPPFTYKLDEVQIEVKIRPYSNLQQWSDEIKKDIENIYTKIGGKEEENELLNLWGHLNGVFQDEDPLTLVKQITHN